MTEATLAPTNRKRTGFRLRRCFDVLGPGLITGASDDDPSGIAASDQIQFRRPVPRSVPRVKSHLKLADGPITYWDNWNLSERAILQPRHAVIAYNQGTL
jgi:hypothetical protein